jgi:predicted phage terminase large subunit-like protein
VHDLGVKGKNLFLLSVFRRRLEYPALKAAVRDQQSLFDAQLVLIEDKASGTQLIQELIADGCHGVTRYQPDYDKIMRLHAQTAIIENGFVHIPEAEPSSHYCGRDMLDSTSKPQTPTAARHLATSRFCTAWTHSRHSTR